MANCVGQLQSEALKNSKRGKSLQEILSCSVRMTGLEPTRLSTPDPKSGAATNYATSALVLQR